MGMASNWPHGPIGPSVFVTGANRGIGLGLAKQLAKCPDVKTIFAGCRAPEKATALHELKEAVHPAVSVKLLQIDVQDDESIQSAFKEVKAALASDKQSLNLLINNSGIFELSGGTALEPEREAYLRHFDVNTVGLAIISATFMPLLKNASAAGEPARILNISSTLGSTELVPAHNPAINIVYGMSKAAQNHYTKALADLEKGVVTVAMCPGWVQTNEFTKNATLTVDESTSAVVKTLAGLSPSHSGTFINHHGQPIQY